MRMACKTPNDYPETWSSHLHESSICGIQIVLRHRNPPSNYQGRTGMIWSGSGSLVRRIWSAGGGGGGRTRRSREQESRRLRCQLALIRPLFGFIDRVGRIPAPARLAPVYAV